MRLHVRLTLTVPGTCGASIYNLATGLIFPAPTMLLPVLWAVLWPIGHPNLCEVAVALVLKRI